ncbi:hypothetical protein CAFE_18540 [Caprobacter fermentans]|uniref:Uncharacterized protein n=1 Tax=Caproicibacter fermentans TaxID=2576756 RepID=A0A6N8HZL4_9FIRM|nr:hypothetical protein [Caproicibacter fermentans]MVB11149.1 hypothetical protein [Caproicibacter fermentans]
MGNLNPAAASHPCMSCKHGGMWKEAANPAGNYCMHPEITAQKGLALGRYHSLRRIPAWCPGMEAKS